MASIRKLTSIARGEKRTRWEYSLQVAGKQERRVYDTEEAAIAALAERQREVQEGRSNRPVPITLKEASDKFVPYIEARALRSAKNQADMLRNQVVPYFGPSIKITQITAEAIRRWEADLTREKLPRTGRARGPATVNRHFALLRRLLRLCQRWGHLRDVPHFEMAKEPPGRLRFLTHEEFNRLVKACRAQARYRNRHLAPIVILAGHTGMRRGEILGLEWRRVDFSRGVLVLEQTKNGRRREVPMSQTVYEVLTEVRKEQAENGVLPTKGFVFRNKKTGVRMFEINNGFMTAAKEAELSDFRFHDLRHTCASWLVMGGASLQEVKEILGHRDFAMTLRYAHLSPGHLRSAVGRLDEVLRIPATQSVSGGSTTKALEEETAVRK
jgi:integrase